MVSKSGFGVGETRVIYRTGSCVLNILNSCVVDSSKFSADTRHEENEVVIPETFKGPLNIVLFELLIIVLVYSEIIQ